VRKSKSKRDDESSTENTSQEIKTRERRRAPPREREEKKYTQIDRETMSLVKENTRKEPSLYY
jgi:hypothetical protein